MASDSTTRRVTVRNPQGLHARPAHTLVSLANRYESEIQIIRDGESADAKSILAILTLAAEEGTQLTIKAIGEDAGAALDALSDLFAQGFGENGSEVKTEESETGGQKIS